MKIKYKKTDIYPYISLNKCVYTSYAEKEPDTVRIRLIDQEGVLDNWKFELYETISVESGDIKTGEMFITGISPYRGIMEIMAQSAPADMMNHVEKTWNRIYFTSICREIGQRHNLELMTYGIENVYYSEIHQDMEDFKFLEKICVNEGCAFIVYDKKLIVYSESYMEQREADILEIRMNMDFFAKENSRTYEWIELTSGNMKAVYHEEGVGNGKMYKKEVEACSYGDLLRYAKNIARYFNKNRKTQIICVNETLPYMAGSVIDIQNTMANSYSGKSFVKKIRHDIIKNTTKMWIRKVQ